MDATAIQRKLARIIGAGPSVPVILPDGTVTTGVRCSLHSSRVAALPGYANQYRGSVVVSVPATLPTIRQLLRVSGVWYRVVGLEQDSAAAGLRIDLGEGASEQ